MISSWHKRRHGVGSVLRRALTSSSGLCGVGGLRTPGDFARLAKSSIESCDKLRSLLHRHSSLPSAHPDDTLRVLDGISNQFCKTMDAAEFFRNAHASPQHQQAADEAFEQLGGYVYRLNFDLALYRATRAVLENGSGNGPGVRSMTEEQRLFAEDMMREFQAEGIHLVEAAAAAEQSVAAAAEGARERAQVAAGAVNAMLTRKEALARQEMEYSRALSPAPTAPTNWQGHSALLLGPFEPAGDELSDYNSLRGYLQDALGVPQAGSLGAPAVGVEAQALRCHTVGEGAPVPEGYVSVPLNYNIAELEEEGATAAGGAEADCEDLQTVSRSGSQRGLWMNLLRSADSPRIRKQLWLGMHSLESAANRRLFCGILRNRDALATQLGFASHANRVCEQRMLLGDTDKVGAFLQGLSASVRGRSEQEFDLLQQLFKDSSSGGSGLKPMGPWDVSSMIDRGRQEARARCGYLSLGSGSDAAVDYGDADRPSPLGLISNYFPVSRCMDGLRLLCLEVFGIRMQQVAMPPEESWVHAGSPALFKFEMSDAGTGEPLGTVFFDLFRRPRKYATSSHFTIRCGCSNHSQDDILQRHGEPTGRSAASLADRMKGFFAGKASDSAAPNEALSEGFQLPVVVVVLNVAPAGSDPTLSMDELEVLFHEFGHAMHSVLSRTTFQHLSGTRGSQDFVEIPSHLFEYFARSKSMLQAWAGVPGDLVEEALAERDQFGRMELQSQLLYSAADQVVHGPRIASIIRGLPRHGTVGQRDGQLYDSVLQQICEAQQELTVFPLAANPSRPGQKLPAMFPLAFTHFTSYAGGYFSYLYARVWAAQIWDVNFQANPLSRGAGRALRDNLLQHGSARDRMSMLTSLCGGKQLDPNHFLRRLGNS